jgi:branched-chain amino acid transport system substrate-binding protein
MVRNNVPAITIILTILGKRADGLLLDLTIRSNSMGAGTQLLEGLRVKEPERLPPIPPSLLDSLAAWEKAYLQWGKPVNFRSRAISLPANPQMNVSDAEGRHCQSLDELQRRIVAQFNLWLGEREVPRTKQTIIKNVSHQQYSRQPHNLSLVLQTRTSDPELNLRLQKLPWSEWNFINEEYPGTGIALSSQSARATERTRRKLRTLVICGSYQDPLNSIDTNSDKVSLEKYLGDRGKLDILECRDGSQPRQALFAKLEQNNYDMIFFCGHSCENNQIYLNDTDVIAVDDKKFKSLLARQKQNGLTLVFLNSCHSLGSASIVESIGVPFTIAMKSAVSDENAQKFIREFVRQATTQAKPIHVAVEEARSVLNYESPQGGLFPVLIQNPEQPGFYLNHQSSPKPLVGLLLLVTAAAAIATTSFFLSQGQQPSVCNYAPQEGVSHLVSCGWNNYLTKPDTPEIGKAFKLFSRERYSQAIELWNKNPQAMYDAPDMWIAYNNAKIEQQLRESKIEVKTIIAAVPITGGDVIKHATIEPLKGIAFAQAQWNDGNNPWKIRVVILDDQNDGNSSKELVQNIAKQSDVLAVIGHYSSTVTTALMGIYQENKLPVISYTSTADSLSNTPYFWRVATKNAHDGREIVKYWAKDLDDFIVFHSAGKGQGVYSKSMKNAFEKAALAKGKKILGSFELSEVEQQKEQIDRAVAKARGILILSDANTVKDEIAGVKTVVNRYGGKIPILGNPLLAGVGMLCGESARISTKPEALSTITFISAITQDDHRFIQARGRGIVQEMLATWKTDWLDYKLINAYDAMQVFMVAAKEAKTREELALALPKVQAKGITETISFKGSDRAEEMTSFVQPKVSGGKCTFTTVPPAKLSSDRRW